MTGESYGFMLPSYVCWKQDRCVEGVDNKMNKAFEMFSVIQQRCVMLIIFFFIPTMMNYYLSNSSPCWQMSTITTTHVLQMMDLSTYLSFYSFIVFDEPIFYALHLFFNSGPRT